MARGDSCPGRHPGARVVLGRRDVLRLTAAGLLVALAPPAVAARKTALAAAAPRPGAGFLGAAELAILDAATARIIPTDDRPGARECGVVDYIQSLLSFLPEVDANCDRRLTAADLTAALQGVTGSRGGCHASEPADANGLAAVESAVFRARPVFAGGPFSGRHPQPHFPTGRTPCQACHGASAAPDSGAGAGGPAVVDQYPPNFFAEFLLLPRVRALSWKIRLLGAAAVPEAAGNPLATESLEVDLRRKYREGLSGFDAISRREFGMPFVQLGADRQSRVMTLADPAFVNLLTHHTLEGMLGVPEYGGNRDQRGWQLVRFDGDSQPLGYTIYEGTAPGRYRERPGKPNAGPNPDEDCAGFSPAVEDFLNLISGTGLVQPGRRFAAPYCLDLPA